MSPALFVIVPVAWFVALAVGVPLISRLAFRCDAVKAPNGDWKHSIMDADRHGIVRTVVVDANGMSVYRRGALEQTVKFGDLQSAAVAEITGSVRTASVLGVRILTNDNRIGQYYFPSRWNAWGVDSGPAEVLAALLNERCVHLSTRNDNAKPRQ